MPDPDSAVDSLEFRAQYVLGCFRDDAGFRNDWLVIDELNRADIDRAFGQLFTVLSGDSVELPFEDDGNQVSIEWLDKESLSAENGRSELVELFESKSRYPVTPSWRVIGTMNTYDKMSLYELSYAFMRRFSFIHVGIPNLENGAEEIRAYELLHPAAGTNYGHYWATTELLEEILAEIYLDLIGVWYRVNDTRKLGPSIVMDMFELIAGYDLTNPKRRKEALTMAITSHVFPQLEGLPKRKQRDVVKAVCKPIAEENDVEFDRIVEDATQIMPDDDILWQKARDMFEVERE